MPHARVALSRSPVDYDTTESQAPPQPGSEHKYLVVPNGPGMRYLRPMKGADHLIGTLHEAAADGSTVSAPADGIASLMAANVIAVATTNT